MAQKFLSIKNFEKYQHYKHRNPPWIKLYNALLDDYEFSKLPTRGKYLYLGLLILCSRHDNRVPNDCTWIARHLHMDEKEIELTPLYKTGLLLASRNHVASVLHQNALSETEKSRDRDRERVETETPLTPLTGAVSKTRGKTIFPEEWKLTDEDKAGWLRFGLNASVEFASFRDHALANDRRCANWAAAFRNWCRKSLERKDRQYVPKVQ